MKKVFTLSLLMLAAFGFTSMAQSTRLILVEEFTQASCGPCASQNPTFNTLLNANPTKVVAIKYQTWWPGYDPMNLQTAALVQVRVPYYQGGPTLYAPYAVMDGTPQTSGSNSGAPSYFSQAKINARAAITSPFDIAVTHTFNAAADSMHISVDVTASAAVSNATVLRIAVIERTIEFCTPPGTNGESDFEGVMRTMIPDADGTAMSGPWTVGQTQNTQWDIAIPDYVYDKSELAVVAFVQNDATKEVLQAGYSAPQPQVFAVDGRIGCGGVAAIPAVSCGTPIAPTVQIQNHGSTVLTSANVNFTVDGVAGPVQAWTGSLAQSGTATVQLPTISSVPGTHTLDVSISDPNAMTDYNTNYDVQHLTYNVYDPAAGFAVPAVQPFNVNPNGDFPPNLWSIVNPDNNDTWIQSVYGNSNTGATRINFYGILAGEIDELWSPNYDFSDPNVTSAQVSFDVAYRGYQGEADRLKVDYSTDCGATWTNAFDEAGTVLASGNTDTVGSWYPWNSSFYHHKYFTLNNVAGQSSVFFRFVGVSAYGNNLFLDNINVESNLTASVPMLHNVQDIAVYPNPSTGLFNLRLNLNNSEDVKVVVTNALGAVVRSFNLDNVSSGVYPVDLSNEAKGSYEVSITTPTQVVTKRISITQ